MYKVLGDFYRNKNLLTWISKKKGRADLQKYSTYSHVCIPLMTYF